MTTKIDTSEVEAFADLLNAINRYIQVEGERAVSKSLDVLENNIVQRTPVNTGAARGATTKEMTTLGTMIRGEVLNPINYALPLEHGRRPGKMPPVDAIKQWVIRKGIATGPEADSAAFLIARAIGRRGTKGAHMFRDGFAASLPQMLRIMLEIPVNLLKRLTV